MTHQQISDMIARGHGMAMVSYREHAHAAKLQATAQALGFRASCDWCEKTGGIDLGSWDVRIWNPGTTEIQA